MASKKKHSEGIALLSMYNDEEDDEMEDAEDDDGEEEEVDAGMRMEEDVAGDAKFSAGEDSANRTAAVDSGNEGGADVGFIPAEKSRVGTSTPQTNNLISPPLEQPRIGRKGALTIVDYGHDEVAMSPEPEEGEIYGSGRVMIGDQLHVSNSDLQDRSPLGTVQVLTPSNQANTPQFSEPLKSDTMNKDAMIRSDDAEFGEADQDEQKYVDPLDKFLPPPSKTKCSEELQRKINKFLEYKKAGKSFNAEVRNRKDYRNPDFLLHAVRYQDIDQIGSCFSKDVFDPHGYDPSDFYDEIEADMRRESERKEQEKKKAQKVEFISGGAQPGIVASASRISMPIAGASAVTASGLPLVPPTADSINRDGRQNKKSKWDKVDGDKKNPLPSAGQDSVSTIGVHAAILSAANAGGGYMQFAQQKRREAEEKRSTERRLERRS
ncbi:hypothetical protein AAZX31_06G061900 [Glycine max]|uniref:SAP30-binding protein n=2 Tax=Glycine subgen. Soja TaxID=1462606 RepID=I1K8Q7_SOYBN|nr:uncharacterized protein LOC100792733 isoform X1 [Glycine max]XP_028235200.1 uncharacterized protein LOC114414943 isoform X1 [Glycine soja]KAG5030926.1 hypothetical protein JHK85_014908 [Glycine max]KAG5147656.1 hypothetical protein JHK82_014537 [Glycine max]KAH1124458.1 hypothetical protein GYH30_014262 [Glycine max]KAH1244729.1 SAP30-binding protein [Glycine max]KRH52374.1 hypothetical protein GLYMA_06G064600v4 [Glycine max]|eukprot:XP_003526255.1 uncharacterized protein LOC100792733 isoform X1 [Glycine max]